MPSRRDESFGATVRREREQLGVSLRTFAKMIGVSPTYLSKIERGELPPPAESKILAIARAVGIRPDTLFAVARQLPADLQDLMTRNPRGMIAFLRSVAGLPDEAVFGLMRAAKAIADQYPDPTERLREQIVFAEAHRESDSRSATSRDSKKQKGESKVARVRKTHPS